MSSPRAPSTIARRLFLAGGSAAIVTGLGASVSARTLRLPVELAGDVLKLPGRITLGDPRGDVTLVEFFDYNCPYCKNAAADLRPLLAAEPKLRYVLVNYAVLGAPSIEAARIALALSLQRTKGGYLALHEKLFRLRGRVDAARALDVAIELGANRDQLIRDADSQRITDALMQATNLGENLGLIATPSFVAGNEAVIGYLDIPQKRRAIANIRRCEKLGC